MAEKKRRHIPAKILAALAGLVVILFIIVQVALTPAVLTRIVNKVAAEFVDGDVRFSKVKASVFKSFPNLNVTLSDFALTYPHEKFAAYDSLYPIETIASRHMNLLDAGRAPATDTLASFRTLSASVNYVDAIKGRYIIRNASLGGPRIFIHQYDSTAANYDILKFSSNPDDTTSSSLPPITVHRILLNEKPFIVFTDPADTLYGTLRLRRMEFDGVAGTADPRATKGSFAIDSLRASGRLPSDTLLLALDRLRIKDKDDAYDVDLSARTFLATKSYGRVAIPVSLSSLLRFPERNDGGFEVQADRLSLDVASLALKGLGDVIL